MIALQLLLDPHFIALNAQASIKKLEYKTCSDVEICCFSR